MTKSITSRFRFVIWVEKILTYGFVIFLTILIFKYSIKRDFHESDFYLIALGVYLMVLVILFFKYQSFHDLKRITVEENGIRIKYLLKKKEEYVTFQEVKKFKKFRYARYSYAGPASYYDVLEIILENDEIIELNASYYSNYSQLKSMIYKNYKAIKKNS